MWFVGSLLIFLLTRVLGGEVAYPCDGSCDYFLGNMFSDFGSNRLLPSAINYSCSCNTVTG